MKVETEKRSGSIPSPSVNPAGGKQPLDPAWAWAAYVPDTNRPWNLAWAGHLYRRAAFGANWEQLQEALANGPQRTIDGLLRPKGDMAAFNRRYEDYEAQPADSRFADELRAWWLQRMIHSPHPLVEKMTLFWHGHFGVSNDRVHNAQLMQHHIGLLRSQALGSFRALLAAAVHDPAMFLSLDAKANRKALPNEGFPRWLLEVHAPGPGSYSNQDVREAARAFTGLFVFQDQLREISHQHDDGMQRILGREGRFNAGDVVHILLEQPAVSQTIVRKLYRWLISETEEPDARMIAPLADGFARSFDLLLVVETMLRSNLFFSSAAYRQRMKSPVEFALGIVHGLEGTVSGTSLASALARLGQNLLHPPTAKGWPGGRNWINPATVAGRMSLAAAMLQTDGPMGGKLHPSAVARKYGHSTSDDVARFLKELFLQGDLEPKLLAARKEQDSEPAARQAAYDIFSLPEFQLG